MLWRTPPGAPELSAPELTHPGKLKLFHKITEQNIWLKEATSSEGAFHDLLYSGQLLSL